MGFAFFIMFLFSIPSLVIYSIGGGVIILISIDIFLEIFILF